MKKAVFFSLVAMVLFSFSTPKDIQWYSLKDGLELARSGNKPVFLFVYVSWCDKCQRMDKKIFPNIVVKSLIEENFVAVKLNPETDTAYLRNDKLIERKVFLKEVSKGKYAIGVPRVVMFDEQKKGQLVLEGLQDPDELRDSIQKFLKK